MAVTSKALLTQDASNRALRTFVQSLAIDVGIAVALLLSTIFTSANSWSDIDWTVLGFLLLKTVLVSAASFVMRRYMDQSSIPTPLPPAPAVEPADDTGAPLAAVSAPVAGDGDDLAQLIAVEGPSAKEAGF